MSLDETKIRLLLIEDNAGTRALYKDVFEREGFQVLMAEDGEKGLSYAQEVLPDIIVLDLMLPKISGMEILKRLRAEKSTKHIPIMIFSACDPITDIGVLSHFENVEYSMKSMNTPKQLTARIRALIDSSRAKLALLQKCPRCGHFFKSKDPAQGQTA